MNKNAALLSVKDLSVKNYDKLILEKINFDVKSGEVIGIIGESGSGKSTICKAIIGLLSPEFSIVEGKIIYKNDVLNHLTNENMRRLRGGDISIIMQNPLSLFNPSRTIGSHVYESLKEHKRLSKKEMKCIAIHYLNKLNLPHAEEIMNKYPYQLSGGMLQRIMIAISLCLEPTILIADEPTTSLDNINQKKVLDELLLINKEQGLAIIIVSHDLDVITSIADRVVVMKNGTIVEHANVAELFDHPKHPYSKELIEARLLLS